MSLQKKPTLKNSICAHPVALSCILGATVLNGCLLLVPINSVRLITIVSEPVGVALLLVVIAATSGIGCLAGMFTCWPWIRPLCSRINGAPFRPGDQVLILTGALRGTVADVCNITKGQGGWGVVWLNLPSTANDRSNLFEEYSLLKITATRS